ncbi:MAG: nucleotidyltransferase [Bacteroidales bacterium]|jgi:dTDP-glucose pyrophosphorylase|nr:nucleotidyltransferase [Bacteroidales bacterium]MBR3986209.1 nucleotidyltransferase [Bacteroidales bacterium]
MKPTLLVLAAGMGSRYGGLKQMDGVGPNGEIIMDYSINDAIRAGFGKVVFVIRHDFAEAFQQKINAEHFGNRIQVEYVYQELDKLPAGFKVPEGREKPWGTNHAILMAKDAIHEPFAIINADDFYGRDAFMVIGDYLRTLENTKGQYCMVGYRLENTLSENGTVSRGVCNIDANGNLAGMTERTSIGRNANGVIEYKDTDDSLHPLAPETTVSMNLFGFTPDYFAESEKLFVEWLKERGNEMKSEYYIPYAVNTFINSGYATMKVLKTTAQWFGVTYKEDRPMVVDRLKKLHDQGVY